MPWLVQMEYVYIYVMVSTNGICLYLCYG